MNKLSVGILIGASIVSFSSTGSVETDTRPVRTMPSFESVDTDGDGVISVSELDAYRSSMPMKQAKGSASSAKQMNRKDSVSAFASYDKNKDGVITQEEFAAHNRYLNPDNGMSNMKMYKEENTNRNKSKNQSDGNKSN
ncbi:EF-hand domain-containing protein [Vibrio ziniensis]|uniref:EF-hand domain-containing protein n=1 Tax=Vibrio ziniensis TaxID=2711221 RepID=A0A6G7CPZ4_9VIBR|nr:EF-hand domain-containing protein [Vibrio ziniensis]QIH44116.1 EF-hand domain-containing protein [Vibrio ziniensis]